MKKCLGKSRPLEPVQLAYQIQGFRIPHHSDAWENNNVQYYHELSICYFIPTALFLVIGLVLYPAGWSNKDVDDLCTIKPLQKPGAFVINDCSLGWAFYVALGGTLASFLCSVLSAQAEKSTSSDLVQDEILDGKTFILLV